MGSTRCAAWLGQAARGRRFSVTARNIAARSGSALGLARQGCPRCRPNLGPVGRVAFHRKIAARLHFQSGLQLDVAERHPVVRLRADLARRGRQLRRRLPELLESQTLVAKAADRKPTLLGGSRRGRVSASALELVFGRGAARRSGGSAVARAGRESRLREDRRTPTNASFVVLNIMAS